MNNKYMIIFRFKKTRKTQHLNMFSSSHSGRSDVEICRCECTHSQQTKTNQLNKNGKQSEADNETQGPKGLGL